MMITALLFTPWARVVRDAGAMPRALADDLLVTANGDQHESIYKKAFEATLEYVQDIGGKVAPDKSTAFSTNRTTRKKLRLHKWTALNNKTVDVITNGRDLGSHLNTGDRLTGTTIVARIKDTIKTATRLARTDFTHEKKAMAVEAVLSAKALYATEAAPASQDWIRKLSTAITRAVGCLLYTSPSPRD